MQTRQPNHFDLARFIAALLVMLTHAFALTPRGPHVEPLVYLSGHRTDLGVVGVAAFFIMSGFLIAGSWERSGRLNDFMRARLLRILPGLALALLLCAVVGAFLTVTPEHYPASAASYVWRNLLMYRGQADLAGVFASNPYGPVVNGSLWTLRHEFTCYLLIAALGLVRQLRLPVMLLIDRINMLRELLPLLAWFMAGACAYAWRAQVVSRALWLALAALTLLLIVNGVTLLVIAPLLAVALIRLLYLPGPLTGFGRYGDFSYGLYIYAFPVQQLLVWLMPLQTPLQNFLMALPLTLALAVLSWYLVERRCLRFKKSRPAPPPAARSMSSIEPGDPVR
jgi:peptidoglycan/LPS O-acetylase OafA/YrhL